MANKIIEPALPVIGVQAGQMATLDLQIGPRYLVIWLIATVKRVTTAPTLADIIGLINVKVNGKVQRSMLATELDALNTLLDPTLQARWRISTNDGATYAALARTAPAAGNTVSARGRPSSRT